MRSPRLPHLTSAPGHERTQEIRWHRCHGSEFRFQEGPNSCGQGAGMLGAGQDDCRCVGKREWKVGCSPSSPPFTGSQELGVSSLTEFSRRQPQWGLDACLVLTTTLWHFLPWCCSRMQMYSLSPVLWVRSVVSVMYNRPITLLLRAS